MANDFTTITISEDARDQLEDIRKKLGLRSFREVVEMLIERFNYSEE